MARLKRMNSPIINASSANTIRASHPLTKITDRSRRNLMMVSLHDWNLEKHANLLLFSAFSQAVKSPFRFLLHELPIMSSLTASSKKRKAGERVTIPNAKKSNSEKDESKNGNGNSVNDDGSDFAMLTLEDIRERIQSLCSRVPIVPEGDFVVRETNGDDTASSAPGTAQTIDESLTREWAAQMQAVVEEFNLLACCVATATYRWGTDRSGAADQNLGLLSGELAASQDQISSSVTPRLSNVLAPVVDLVIAKTVTSKDDVTGVETKENYFTQKLVDPDFLSLCHTILARNAPLLRHIVLSNFHKLVKTFNDYLKAQKNDTQHSQDFTY